MKKLGKLLLILIILVILTGLVLFVFAFVKDLFLSDSIETAGYQNTTVYIASEKETNRQAEKKNPIESVVDIFTNSNEKEDTTYSSKKSEENFFYKQLNETSKIIYNGFQESKDKLTSGEYSIEFGNQFHDLLSQQNGDKILGQDYQSAIEAFTHDNPDLFYIDIQKIYLNIETKKRVFNTTYNVYVKPLTGKKYFSDGFKSQQEVIEAINKIKAYRDKIISRKTNNKYENIKLIHDYLIDSIEYDEKNQNKNKYTIYGALVDKKCVCEGYARAFKYIADEMEIENIFMQGTATNSEDKTENHAWNAVKLYGTWYLIDTTWDDPIIVGEGYAPSNVHYRYFLKGTDSFYKDHKLDPQFTKNGKVFKYPSISKDDYSVY